MLKPDVDAAGTLRVRARLSQLRLGDACRGERGGRKVRRALLLLYSTLQANVALPPTGATAATTRACPVDFHASTPWVCSHPAESNPSKTSSLNHGAFPSP